MNFNHASKDSRSKAVEGMAAGCLQLLPERSEIISAARLAQKWLKVPGALQQLRLGSMSSIVKDTPKTFQRYLPDLITPPSIYFFLSPICYHLACEPRSGYLGQARTWALLQLSSECQPASPPTL